MQAENKQTNTKHGEANLKQTTKHETWWSKFTDEDGMTMYTKFWTFYESHV